MNLVGLQCCIISSNELSIQLFLFNNSKDIPIMARPYTIVGRLSIILYFRFKGEKGKSEDVDNSLDINSGICMQHTLKTECQSSSEVNQFLEHCFCHKIWF